MNLTDDQKAMVRKWLEEGVKLSDIQKRLASELGVHLTYMEVRLLVSDLQVMPKDAEPPPSATPTSPQPPPAEQGQAVEEDEEPEMPDAEMPEAPAAMGNVNVSLDTVAMPGAALSGKVTFSDGQKAQWYLDQYGRLGIAPATKGYRPSPTDVQAFQMRLQQELEKMGF